MIINLIIGVVAFIVGILCMYKATLCILKGDELNTIIGIFLAIYNLSASAIIFCIV